MDWREFFHCDPKILHGIASCERNAAISGVPAWVVCCRMDIEAGAGKLSHVDAGIAKGSICV